MKIIGITGGVGAGKTEILEYLNNKYGASICHTDKVGKKLQKKGGVCYDAIVFSNPAELEALNRIVHPAVKNEVDRLISHEKRKNTNLFIIESAILIEANYGSMCDELWYIYVDDETRRKRLYYSRGYDTKKIDEIIAAQLPKDQFLRNCDRAIDNSGDFSETMFQLDSIIKEL